MQLHLRKCSSTSAADASAPTAAAALLCFTLQPFTITHAGSGTLIRAVKGTQLYRANPAANDQTGVAVGDAYTYEAEGKGGRMDQYLVEVIDLANGSDREYVPRCIEGNMGEQLVSRRSVLHGMSQLAGQPLSQCDKRHAACRRWLIRVTSPS
jgi:hypothetical protein